MQHYSKLKYKNRSTVCSVANLSYWHYCILFWWKHQSSTWTLLGTLKRIANKTTSQRFFFHIPFFEYEKISSLTSGFPDDKLERDLLISKRIKKKKPTRVDTLFFFVFFYFQLRSDLGSSNMTKKIGKISISLFSIALHKRPLHCRHDVVTRTCLFFSNQFILKRPDFEVP